MDNMKKILALIKACGGKIQGRTKLQKLVYILKNHGVDFDENFKYHHYGPYSFNLQLEITELVDCGLLKEAGSTPYIYELESQAAKEVDNSFLAEKKELIDFLNKQDYQILELVATIYYLKNTGIHNDLALRSKLQILKPHLEQKIESAFKVFYELEEKFKTSTESPQTALA